MSKWRMEYEEVGGEKFPLVLWCDTRPVIMANSFFDDVGKPFLFLDMHDHEVAEVLEKLNRAEGE